MLEEIVENDPDAKDDIIKVIVMGGVVCEITGIPKNVSVRVYDYDTEGADEDDPRLETDDEGKECFVEDWGSD